MCVLNVFNFTNNKLHLLPLNCFCFMSQAPSFSCPRKTIQSLPMSRKRCSFFMCVLNVFYCKIAFVATKLPVSFMYVVGSLDTVVILNCVVSCSWLPLTSCPRRVSLCRNIAFIAIKGRAQIDHAFSVGLRRLPPPVTLGQTQQKNLGYGGQKTPCRAAKKLVKNEQKLFFLEL